MSVSTFAECLAAVRAVDDPADIIGVRPALTTCACGETTMPGAPCLNIGACETADRAATAQSLRRGVAAVGRPAAWTISGRVD